MKKHIALALAAVLCLTALYGCNSQEGTTKDTLTVLGTLQTTSFDPVLAMAEMDSMVTRGLFDTLVRLDEKGEAAPGLAKSWTLGEDNLTYTFTLSDAKFHDGSVFDADDVIYTLDTIMPNPVFYIMSQFVAGYEKIDQQTVTIKKAAYSTKLLHALAAYVYIVPSDVHANDSAGFAQNPVGTGPYKLVQRLEDATVEMEANPDYFLGEPYFKKYIVNAPLDPSSAVIAMETGNIDFMFRVPPAQTSIVEDNDKLNLVTHESWSIRFLLFLNQGLDNDLNLRKAFYHGIDRDSLITVATEGTGAPAGSLYSTLTLQDLAGTVEMAGYDPALAQEYLSASDYKPGTEINLVITPGYELDAQAVQQDMGKLGVTVKIEQLDLNSWVAKVLGGEADMILTDIGDFTASVVDHLDSWTSMNLTWGHLVTPCPDYSDLVAQAKVETDTGRLEQLIRQALQLTYDQALFVNLYVASANMAYHADLTGIHDVMAATYTLYPNEVKMK